MRYEYVYSSNQYVPKKKNNFSKVVKYVVFSILIFSIGFYATALLHKTFFMGDKSIGIISPLTDPLSKSFGAIQSVMSTSGLPEVVEKELEGSKGAYSVVVKNLKTGEYFAYNEHKKYDSASLYKLWTMAAVMKEVERGDLSLDKQIKYDIEDINRRFDLASESAELTEGTFQMSIKSALNQMITISHNYAALSLTLEVGLSNVTKFLKDYGFKESSTKSPPSTTASDIAIYFEKLYAGELASKEYTTHMLDLLKRQTLNDRIPKYLPDAATTAHKTGELGFVKHDAGIVYTPKGDYVIVLMSETSSPLGAAEREAKISEAVYNYFAAQ